MYPWVSHFTDSEGAMQGSVRQAYHIDLLRATSYEWYANSRVFPTPGSRLSWEARSPRDRHQRAVVRDDGIARVTTISNDVRTRLSDGMGGCYGTDPRTLAPRLQRTSAHHHGARLA